MPVVDALNSPGGSLNVEGACGAHRHAPLVHTGLLAGGDSGADVITGLEAVDPLAAHEVPAGEPVLGEARPLVGAPSGGADDQGGDPPGVQCADLPDVRSVERVRLRDFVAGAIELRAATRGNLDR